MTSELHRSYGFDFRTYDRDAANEGHIAQHGLSRVEVEQAMEVAMEFRTGYRNGELRSSLVGATAAGRVLFVVITTRRDSIRVVTAYPAQPKMKALYETLDKR